MCASPLEFIPLAETTQDRDRKRPGPARRLDVDSGITDHGTARRWDGQRTSRMEDRRRVGLEAPGRLTRHHNLKQRAQAILLKEGHGLASPPGGHHAHAVLGREEGQGPVDPCDYAEIGWFALTTPAVQTVSQPTHGLIYANHIQGRQ